MEKKLARAAALICTAGFLLSGCGPSEREETRVVRVESGSLRDAVEESGLVTYRDPFSVIPLVNGKILSCAIEEGDRVEAGQELYRIDAGDLEDQIVQAQLSLKRAQESSRQAQAACEDLVLKAEVSGAVTAVHVHKGDFVGIGTPVAEVVDSVHLKVTVPFSREDAARLIPGSAAQVSFAAYGESLPGTVQRIYETASALPGGREGICAEISLVNPGTLTAGTIAVASVGDIVSMDGGPVEYATAQAIYSAQSGQVQSLSVQAGDAVEPGQTILTIENAGITNGAANARLAAESAAVSLSQLESKREDFTICAPVSGTVSVRNFKTGDFASVATPLAAIVQESSMCVTVPVDEVFIDRIRPGLRSEVTFTTESGEQNTYQGEVSKISDTGITSGGVTDYPVELSLEHTEGLKAGMNVTVSIVVHDRENCLKLPSEAVRDGKVKVRRGGKTETVPVVPGVTGSGETEIISGLTEGDEVVLP